MNEKDEKFFEELAKERRLAESDFEIELAKSGSALEKPAHLPKSISKIYEDEPEGQLAIDVYQTSSSIVVESAIAGIKPEDIDVSVTGDSVTIRGERRREEDVKRDDYFYQECYWGRFSRSVILPQEVDPEEAEVTFKSGILRVVMPKLNRKKTKKLKVKTE